MISILPRLLGRMTRGAPATPAPVPPELSRVATYSMSAPQVLQRQYALARDVVARSVGGDFVECGVCNGGSAAAIALGFRGAARHIWLYDSFEGLPTPKEVDGLDATSYEGRCVGSEDAVRAALRIANVAAEDCTIRKGWFQQTFQRPLPDAVAFLHVDADWYESVMLTLMTFYDRVSEGGVILLDDFGHWEGCREAFYDFAANRNIKPLLERFGHSQGFWIKGKPHNRGG